MSSLSSGAAALILNGGRGLRMGGADKSQIVVQGQPLVQRQVEVLSQRFSAIAMVGDAIALPKGLALRGLGDRVGGKGPLDGIAAGLAWSPEDWLFVVASDMPYPSLALLDLLLDARDERRDLVCVCAKGRAQPLFALYHRRLLPILDARLASGQLRARELVRESIAGVRVVHLAEERARLCDPQLESFRNLNSPEDLLTS